MAGISLASAVSALLLTVLILMQASHALDPASSTPSSVEYWQKVLPSSPLPAELLKRASPLDSSAALLTSYTQLTSSGHAGVRPPGLSSLCMAGRLYCNSLQFAAFRRIFPSCTIQNGFRKPDLTAQQLNQGSFFRERDLVEGALLVLQDQKDRAPFAPFLPRQLASKLHPASATLLQAAFRIPPSSLLAKESIHTSNSLCKIDAEDLLPGEEAFCAYSLEDLADELKTRVVAGASGTSLQLLPVSSSSAETARVQARLLKVKLEVEAAQPYLSCHAKTYPFAVHFCHHIPNTRIYSATFQVSTHVSSSEIVHAVAICHMDTSNWSPQHVAFADLHTTPGRAEACHWTHESGLIFVATKS